MKWLKLYRGKKKKKPTRKQTITQTIKQQQEKHQERIRRDNIFNVYSGYFRVTFYKTIHGHQEKSIVQYNSPNTAHQ